MATVGTAKVKIEADFSKFQSDMETFFGRAGQKAGQSLERGVKSGADAAKQSVRKVGDEFTKVPGQASSAGRSASRSWSQEIQGVGKSTSDSVKVASTSLTSLSGAGSSAARSVSTSWSSNIAGVSKSTESASRSAARSLGSVANSGTSSSRSISVSFANGFGQVASAASGAASRVGSALGGVGAQAAKVGANIRQSLSEAFRQSEESASRIPGAVGRIGLAVAAVAGPMAALKGGFDRLMTLQKADIMFRNIGLSTAETERQMAQLNDVVTGTSVSLADASQTAGMLMQAGVKAGKPLNDSIKAMANISAISGAAASDVGMVMMQIKATGKLMAGDALQLQSRGVNVYGYLAESLGKSYQEVRKMGEEGKITYEMVVDAINAKTGDLAKEMGETLPAKIANFKTAMSSLGATIIEPFIGPAATAVTAFTNMIKGLNAPLKAFFGWLQGGSAAANVLQGVLGGLAAAVAAAFGLMAVSAAAGMASMVKSTVIGAVGAMVNGAKIVGSVLSWPLAFAKAAAGALMSAGQMVVAFGTMAAGWIRAGIAATINAAKIAGAWLMAAPKHMALWVVAGAQMVAGWVKAGAVATVNAVKIAAAWLMAAPKNPLVWAKAFAMMVAGWIKAGAMATVNAVKIAAAWVVANASSAGPGIVALAQVAAGWIKAGFMATINAAKIAAAWLVAMWPVALVIAAIGGIILVFKQLWDNVAGFREFFVGIWNGITGALSGAWEAIKNTVVGAWQAIVGFFQSDGVANIWNGLVTGAQTAWSFITAVWGGLVDFFGGVFGGIAAVFTAAWTGVSAVFMWIWETVLSPIFTWISDTWGRIAEVVGPAWDAISEKLSVFGGWLIGFWQGTLWPMLSGVINWFQRIGSAIGSFIAEHWSVLKPALILLGAVLLAPIVLALGAVVIAITAVIAIVGAVVAAITGFIYVLVKLPGWIMSVVRAIRDWFGRAWQWTKDAFAKMGAAVSGWWSDHVAPLPGKVGGAIGGVIDWFRRLPGKIMNAVAGAGRWLWDTGRNIIQGLMDGMASLAGRIGSWFLDRIPGWIKNPFKAALGIHSPSRVFAGYGKNIGEGLIQGVRGMRSSVQGATQGLADSAAAVKVPEMPSQPVSGPVLAPAAASFDMSSVDLSGGLESAAMMATMMEAQQETMVSWGATAQAQTSTMVNPALQSVGTTAVKMNTTQFQPTMLAMQAAMTATGVSLMGMNTTAWQPSMLAMQNTTNATGRNTMWNAYGVMNPALQSVASVSWNVLRNGVNPAMSGIRGALTHTANTFGWAAGNIAAQWSQVREATARPVRFAIQSVFNDGLVGMWNSVSDLLGTKKMGAYPIRFARGGILPGYTPGRDPYTFVEPNTGMSIGLSGGEAIMRPEVARAMGGGWVDGVNAAARMGGPRAVQRYLGGYAGGGVVESITGLVRRFWPMMTVTSTYRNTADHHGGGRAVDFSNGYDSTPAMRSATAWFAKNYQPALLELIHSPSPFNIKNGRNVGNGFGFYGAGTMAQHRNHVHVAASRPLPMPGGALASVSGDPGMGDWDIAGAFTQEWKDKISSAVKGYRGSGGLIDSWPPKVAEKLTAAADKKIDELFMSMSADPGGGDVQRWAPLVSSLLKLYGHPASWLRNTLRRMNQESGGNPRAINLWDSNAAKGIPSKGLMQVIDPTFAAYRDPRFPNDIWDPRANIAASMRYTMRRYGSLPAGYDRAGGYAHGGLMPEGQGWFHKTAKQPERVLSPRQTSTFEELMDFLGSSAWDAVADAVAGRSAGVSGGSGVVRTVEVTNHFHGPADAEMVSDRIEDRLLRSNW